VVFIYILFSLGAGLILTEIWFDSQGRTSYLLHIALFSLFWPFVFVIAVFLIVAGLLRTLVE
jgi:hypothetical protein